MNTQHTDMKNQTKDRSAPMRRFIAVTLFALASLFTGKALAQDQAPITLTYQGSLSNAAGEAINADRPMTFRLYTQAEGGDPVWSEQHDGVPVVDGVFSVVLGALSAIPDGFNPTTPLYLGVTIDDDGEITPRMVVGGAIRAQWAAVAAQALDVRDRHIHPSAVNIGETPVINDQGQWVGDPTGLVGPPGPAGPAGAAGPNGADGADGAQGIQGPIGSTGAAGPNGADGADGAQGIQGPIGSTGAAGPNGADGADGAQGIQGPIGPTGIQGIQGAVGLNGADGVQGIQGPIGSTGAAGQAGPAGLDGADGAVGAQGLAGLDGAQGIQGPIGPTGIQGIQGVAGLNGADGAQGIQGPIGPEASDTTCTVVPLEVDGVAVPGAVVLTCGNQAPIRLTTFQCGNGAIDPGETCDDGNLVSADGCDVRCLNECGNGRLDGVEACDDGNLQANDACTDVCAQAVCGDAIIWLGQEACDNGAANSQDPGAACRVDCTARRCGDSVTDPGEDCDDGNATNTDACTNACADARCGDGFTGPGEECDDGNGVDTDACTNVCAAAVCGDGIRGPGEACDGEAGCAADCQSAAPCFAAGCPDLGFVALTGGAFSMGGLAGQNNTQPAHQVNVPDFELMRTEVTVAQYRACVNAGACDAPNCTDANTSGGVIVCNYSQNRNDHPVNYVSWINARQFSTWVGARLPSESEWEFAAKSRGQNITYPWGDAAPTCNHADFWINNTSCHGYGTSAVCTHAAGNSAQGVCDLAGNLYEWLQDEWHGDYNGAPGDGSAWGADANNGASRVRRGGSWYYNATNMRAAYRNDSGPTDRAFYIGFRLAR